MTPREPRKDWSLDNEGGAWEDEGAPADEDRAKRGRRLGQAAKDASLALNRAFKEKHKK